MKYRFAFGHRYSELPSLDRNANVVAALRAEEAYPVRPIVSDINDMTRRGGKVYATLDLPVGSDWPADRLASYVSGWFGRIPAVELRPVLVAHSVKRHGRRVLVVPATEGGAS